MTANPMSLENPTPIRYGPKGQRLCSARSRRTGELCQGWALEGQRVCANHGGLAPQSMRKAKLRLAELVDPAIATLAREMTTATSSKDRMAAANSILDRAGWGRVSSVEVGDARDLLINRLIALRDEQYTAPPPTELTVIEGTVDGDSQG